VGRAKLVDRRRAFRLVLDPRIGNVLFLFPFFITTVFPARGGTLVTQRLCPDFDFFPYKTNFGLWMLLFFRRGLLMIWQIGYNYVFERQKIIRFWVRIISYHLVVSIIFPLSPVFVGGPIYKCQDCASWLFIPSTYCINFFFLPSLLVYFYLDHILWSYLWADYSLIL
jgi:hypothetical protein